MPPTSGNYPNPTHALIEEAIKAYAGAYKKMEEVQSSVMEPSACLIPRGDQKTGAIGEYWAMRYARKRWAGKTCVFGNHSQHGWDIHVIGTKIWIQVKTVSEWSKSRVMSPLHAQTYPPKNPPEDWASWSQLWLIFLNKDFYPTGFWQIDRIHVDFKGKQKLSGLKIRKPGGSNGSSCVKWPLNTVDLLLSDH